MQRVLLCTFPFPEQSPPVQASHPCVQCPNADRRILDQHAGIARDDPELQAVVRRFVEWFFNPDDAKKAPPFIDEVVRYGCDLYTRADHTGTCIPKTVLFAYYKGLQFASGYPLPRPSDAAAAALRGEPVASWPDGDVRQGRTWRELFTDYTARYE